MRRVETFSVIEKALLFAEWRLFEQLAMDEVALIAARTGEAEYIAGEIIDPKGPTGDCLHLVVSGAIELLLRERSVRTAGEGEVIGSLAVLGGKAADERLRALEPTHALVLSGADFESAVADHPDFALALIRSLIALVRGPEGAPERAAKEG